MPFGKRSYSSRNVLRRAAPAVLCSAVLAGAALAVPAASARADTPAPTAGVATGLEKVSSAPSVLSYWTAARLRAAKAIDTVVAGKAPTVVPPATAHLGPPGRVAGGGPLAGQGPVPARSTAGPSRAALIAPYDSFTVTPALVPTWPYRVNGRLFFTNNNINYSCSATSVASASGVSNENEIWTAGHCLVNAGGNNRIVDSSAVFIPAYNGNVSNYAPFGSFVWNGGWTTTSAWYYNRDLTADEAAMTVATSSLSGQSLGVAVGWDGFAWNQPVNQQFVAFGYPADSPYNGRDMVEDIAATAGQDGSISGAKPVKPLVIGNPMTGGSSGGAWNISWTTSSPGYINGHNDYKYASQPLLMYSPYQDSLSNAVRCFGASTC